MKHKWMELENQLKSHKERLDRLEKALEISKIRIIALMRATGTELPPEDYDRIVEIRRRKEGEG